MGCCSRSELCSSENVRNVDTKKKTWHSSATSVCSTQHYIWLTCMLMIGVYVLAGVLAFGIVYVLYVRDIHFQNVLLLSKMDV